MPDETETPDLYAKGWDAGYASAVANLVRLSTDNPKKPVGELVLLLNRAHRIVTSDGRIR